jgi:prepilin-type N-terminal cleavage/methylation domain-containing protein
MQTQKKIERGFSLLETLIVMAVVLIMMAAITPNIHNAMQNYRLIASAQEMASQIQSARYRALRNNAMCIFLLLPSSRQFGIDVNGDGSLTGADIVLSLNTNVSFTDLSSTPPTGSSGATLLSSGSLAGLGFTPRATLTRVNSSTGQPDFSSAVAANGFAIYLANTRNRFSAVTVSSTGRVRTWSSGNGAYWK